MSQLNNNEKHRKEKLTVMLIPHSGGKSALSFSVPIIALKILGGVLATVILLVALGSLMFSVSYKKVKAHAEELAVKAQEYDYLQEQLNLFVRRTKDLEIKLKDIEKLDKDLRELLSDDPELKTRLETEVEKDDNIDKTAVQEPGEDENKVAVLASRLRPTATIAHRGGIDRSRALKDLGKLEGQVPQQKESLKELKDLVEKRCQRLACTPSIWPVRGKISSNFGYRRSPFGSRREFHDGLDIAAPYGTTVVATADGVVTFAGYVSGYGYTVRVNHGYGYETSYSHNSKILVKVGQGVKKGQAIAQVGSSGRSTGPHLHYMVKENGVLKNPREFMN